MMVNVELLKLFNTELNFIALFHIFICNISFFLFDYWLIRKPNLRWNSD